jgi:hypothetical protein
MRSQSEGISFLWWLAVVRLRPAHADEKDVSDLDIAALGLRPDVDALVFAASGELFPGYGVLMQH